MADENEEDTFHVSDQKNVSAVSDRATVIIYHVLSVYHMVYEQGDEPEIADFHCK